MAVDLRPQDLKPDRIDTYKNWQEEQKIPVVRGFFVEGAPSHVVAHRFGYSPGAFRVLCHQFRHDPTKRAGFFQTLHGHGVAAQVNPLGAENERLKSTSGRPATTLREAWQLLLAALYDSSRTDAWPSLERQPPLSNKVTPIPTAALATTTSA